MAFRDFINSKTVRFVALSLVLGAFGSGLWEWLLKPSLLILSNIGLNVATLGLSKFKDALYQEVALGFHEGSSLKIYLAVFAFLPCFVLGMVSGFLTGSRSSRQSQSNKTDTLLAKVVAKLLRPMAIIIAFLMIFSIVQANQDAYINRAITHFHALLQIARPYVSEEKRIQYESQFAQVSSKADYEALVAELTTVCRSKNLRTPEFGVW